MPPDWLLHQRLCSFAYGALQIRILLLLIIIIIVCDFWHKSTTNFHIEDLSNSIQLSCFIIVLFILKSVQITRKK